MSVLVPRSFTHVSRWRALLATWAIVSHGCIVATGVRGSEESADSLDLSLLDIGDLLQVEFRSAAGLTSTDWRRLPSSLTELDGRDIRGSGTRDLNHLLEIYVPNAQFIDHHHLQPHLGFRGIISDREDKYVYQVNGRTMNNRTLLGADNERALPLLGDVRAVNVVRGPASATHGAGAVAGVVNVETFNGLTFSGADAYVRQDLGDYSSFETRYGKRLGSDTGVFLYYGVARPRGADADYYIGHSYPAANGLPANVAGRPAPVPKARLGEGGFGGLWHKFHGSYVRGPVELWVRYVQDGGQDRPMREIYTATRPADVSLEAWTRGRQFRNRQLTFQARYVEDLSEDWNLELVQSFDTWWWRDQRAGVYDLPIRNGREQEYLARAIARWQLAPSQTLAFGADFSREWFHDPPYSDTLDRAPIVADRDWTTNRFALLAEHQWHSGDSWTTVASLRTDKHTFSGWLWSPRLAVIFSPSAADTFKVMAGQSMRRGGDEELWAEWVRNRTIPRPETLRSVEFSYERELGRAWRASTQLFFEDYDAIGWIPALYYSSRIGRFRIGGAEFELSHQGRRTRVALSHGYTRLLDASLPAGAPAGGQAITAEPYGFGHELAEWAPGITKVAVVHTLNPHWDVSASLVHYSGFPGARDYADYAATFASPPSAMPVSDPGYTEPYGANLYANLGMEFRPSERWAVRVDATNLAALVDATLSKRNYYFRFSEFSVQPAGLTVSLHGKF